MQNEFLIVHKDVLPPYYAKVAKAVYLMEHETKSVSDVCKELDISRSTFYKYKDKVFELPGDYGRKAILSFKVEHEKGVLSSMLNGIAELGGNVLTINQDMPIHNLAYITITIDTKDLSLPVYDLIGKLKKIQRIKDVNLVAFE
jgi:chorismate mutase